MNRVAIIALLVACSQPASKPPALPEPPKSIGVPVAPRPVDPLNLDFEQVDGDAPKAWESKQGAIAAVTDEKHGGARSLKLVADGADRYARTKLDAAAFVGKRIRVGGFIKTKDADAAALWIRADDASGNMLVLENMAGRLSGSVAWTKVNAELGVPANASALLVGAMVLARGTAWFDDLAIEVTEIKPPQPIVIAGTVVDAAGAPAANASVALITADDLEKFTNADAQGKFALEAVEGRWGISAHGAGGVGAFLAQRAFAGTERDLKIVLAKDGGVTVRGKLKPKPAAATTLEIGPFSANDADVFAVPVAADGTFSAVLPRGEKYNVKVIGGYASGVFDRKGDVVDVVLDNPVFGPPPADVVAYIEKHAIPLAAVEAGKGFEDMAKLGALVGKARIVALGEATHGTREFFQLKHRILEYLVAKQGFTVFAIEANQPECRAINDYVLNGKGTAKDALAGIYFWTWNTEEVLAMIEWMRAWNADATHTQKIQFTGFDMQTTKVAHANIAKFLDGAAHQFQELLPAIAILGLPDAAAKLAKATPDQRDVVTDALAKLTQMLAKTPDDIKHDLRILEQAAAMYTSKTPFEARDVAMAENVSWLLDQTHAKIVVWAHNGHISNKLASLANMGSHLRKKYKQAYVNIGFAFGEGSFQAMDFTQPSRVLAEATVGPPPEGFASVAFARSKKAPLVLDLRAVPKGPVREWFATRRPVREIGAVWSGERSMVNLQSFLELFDAVIYVDKTTRARPITR